MRRGLQHVAKEHSTLNSTDLNTIRAMIETAVHAALSESVEQLPDAIRKVLEDDARAIRESKAFQPTTVEHTPSGTCWACGELGKSEEMMWLDQFDKRSHLVHATVECVRAAESKPEQREHRG